MTRFAAGTDVPVDRSRAEIEKTLMRYGANSFAYGWDQHKAVVEFAMEGRRVRFVLPMPDLEDPEFTMTPTGRPKTATAARSAWEQAQRQRWRALGLVVKAKLEAVETGITTFDEEFLAHLVLPNGSTVGEWAVPQVEISYEKGSMPALMPGLR